MSLVFMKHFNGNGVRRYLWSSKNLFRDCDYYFSSASVVTVNYGMHDPLTLGYNNNITNFKSENLINIFISEGF